MLDYKNDITKCRSTTANRKIYMILQIKYQNYTINEKTTYLLFRLYIIKLM